MKTLILACLALSVEFVSAQVKITFTVTDTIASAVSMEVDTTRIKDLQSQWVIPFGKDNNRIIVHNRCKSPLSVTFRNRSITKRQTITVKEQSDQILQFDKNGTTDTTDKNHVSLFSGKMHIGFQDANGKGFLSIDSLTFSVSDAKTTSNQGPTTADTDVIGTAFYDASSIGLVGEVDPSTQRKIVRVLAYYENIRGNLTLDAIATLYCRNPFLYPLIQDYRSRLAQIYVVGQVSSQNPQDATNISGISLSSLGGLDVTNLADGMAKFLVTRTKRELAVAFFDDFKTAISDPRFKDLQDLFPETYHTLNAIGDQIYNYDAYIQALRESFEKDLSELITHLPKIIDNHPAYFEKHKDYKAILRSGCYLAEGISEKEHPGDILTNYPAAYLDDLNKNWKGTIQTLQLVSRSLRDTAKASDSTSYWVSPSQIKKLLSDSTTFKIYLGLLYQQSLHFDGDSIRFEKKTLADILNPIAQNFTRYYSSYRDYFTRVASKANRLTELIKNYKKSANDSVAAMRYYDYASATLDLFESASEVGKLVQPDSLNAAPYVFFKHAKESLTLYFGVIRSATNVVRDIKRRSYASAVVNAASIYSSLVSQQSTQESDALKKNLKDASSAYKEAKKTISGTKSMVEDLSKGIDTRVASVKSAESIILGHDSLVAAVHELRYANEVMNDLVRYGAFMAAIVQAKNSDEVESAIEAVAMPPGSYRVKRNSCVNISMNAYVGLFGGYERIINLDPAYAPFKSRYNAGGITAPIGIAAGTSTAGWSFSLFVSLVDIGAITAFRFTNDSTKQIPTIHLSDIVSPGAFFSLGVRGMPISLNLGVQVSPTLRAVTATSNDYGGSMAYRYSASLCIDIPLLDFYTQSKR